MGRIAFFSIPAQGHTNPTLPLVAELVRRGHQVRYYSYQMLRDKIEKTGAQFVPCDSFDAQLALTPAQASRLGSDLGLSTRVLVDTTLALDAMVMAQMDAWRPDCIVSDSMAPWGKAVAGKLGIPYICSTTTFAFNRHSARVMRQSPWELMNMLLAMPKINRDLQRLRRQGYPVKNILDLIGSDEGAHTIVYTSREFQPCSDTFSEKFAFVGPLLPRAAAPIEKTRDKLVYLSMGTVNNDLLPLYSSWVRAMADSPWQVILSLGHQVNPKDLGPLPEHIRAYPAVDQIAVLEKADVFVTHCGMNSVSEGLYHGVPLAMLPQTKEQQGVAGRVLELGAGILLSREDELPAAIDKLLSSPSFRTAAQKIRRSFLESPGVKGAADKVEEALSPGC